MVATTVQKGKDLKPEKIIRNTLRRQAPLKMRTSLAHSGASYVTNHSILQGNEIAILMNMLKKQWSIMRGNAPLVTRDLVTSVT